MTLCFDIGANIGKWTLANYENYNKIIAVEASPKTYKNLKKNLERKNNAETLHFAVCESSKEKIDFFECKQSVLSTLNEKWLNDESSRFNNSIYNKIKVNTITIDKLIELYGVPNLIKIDVEGGEYSVIKSLSIKVPLICFEWASETNEITFNCLDYLEKLGFNLFSLQHRDNYIYRPKEFISINEIKRKLNNTKPKIHWGMVWCK